MMAFFALQSAWQTVEQRFMASPPIQRLGRGGSKPTDAWIVGRAAPQFRHWFYGSVKGTNNWYRPAHLFASPASMSAQEQIKQREDADWGEKYDYRGQKHH
jgi:hypothetical protein